MSGTALERLSGSNVWTGCAYGLPIRIVLDAGAYTDSVTCDPDTGAFSFSNVPLTTTHVITIYMDTTDGQEQGVLYTRNANTTSNLWGLRVSEDYIRLRTESSGVGPITNAHINTWDSSNDSSIPAISDGTTLTTSSSQQIGVYVESGSTYRPGGDVTVEGMHIDGTYTADSTTLTLASTGSNGCSTTSTLSSQNPLCVDGNFNAGTGIVRYTLQGSSSVAELNDSVTFNVLEVAPVSSTSRTLRIDTSVTAATALLGNGTGSPDVDIQSTFTVTGNATIATGVDVVGDGTIEVRGDFTSSGSGHVDDWDLTVRLRAQAAVQTFGSTSGSASWAMDRLEIRTNVSGAVARPAAGGTGSIVADFLVVGSSFDSYTATLDLDTTDRAVGVDYDATISTRGHLEMSNVRTMTVARDAFVDGSLVSNGSALSVGRDLDMGGAGTMTMLASTVTVGRDAYIDGTYTVSGAGMLDIAGNLRKTGTFTAGSGTVRFSGSASPVYFTQTSPTTFNNLVHQVPDKVLRMSNTHLTTVSGTLTVTGSSCLARAALASQVDGSPFSIAAAAVSINYADIGDSNQTSGTRTAPNSWNHGGNSGWNFSLPTCTAHTVSGVALQSEGGPAWSMCDGVTKNITLSINGFSATSVACNATTGAFSVTTSVEPNQLIAVFMNANLAGERGAVMTRGASPVASVTGLTLVRGQVRLRSESTFPLTNDQIHRYDATLDSDIPVDVDPTTLQGTFTSGYEAFVEAGETYAPGASTTAQALDLSGTIGSVGGSSGSFTVTGNGTDPSCTAPIGTSIPLCVRPGGSLGGMTTSENFVFSGTGGVHVAAITYPTVRFAPPSGSNRLFVIGTSPSDNTVVANAMDIKSRALANLTTFDANLTIENDLWVSGTLSGTSASSTVLVNDDVNGTGTIDMTAGTFLMEATGSTTPLFCTNDDLTVRVWDFVAATSSASTRTVSADDNCSVLVRNELHVGRPGDSGVTRLDLNSEDNPFHVDGNVRIHSSGELRASNSQKLVIAGNFTNDGAFLANNGTIEFDTPGTVSAITHSTSTSFGTLRVAVEPKELRFNAGRTTAVSTLQVIGSSCLAPVDLRSTTPGDQYTLDVTNVALQYATLRDSIAAPTRDAALTGDLGNNSGWTFTGGCTPGLDTMFVDDDDASTGMANNPAVGSDEPHLSWINQSGMALDQQQARIITTPLTSVAGLWQFDTATGITSDSSGNGRTLSTSGTPTSPAGQSGFDEALGLDGASRVSVSHSSLNQSSNFAVEAWARIPDTAATQVIVDRSSGSSINYRLDVSGGNLRAHATRSSSGVTTTISTSAAAFADSSWHHVALVMDSGFVLRLYLDGVEAASQGIGGSVWSSSASLSIGATTGAGSYLTGQIDDVRVSSVARSAAEVSGYARLRDAHAKVIWTSAPVATSCAIGARCDDLEYDGPPLRRPGGRYYVEARGRMQPWVAFTAWSPYDWFETSALLSISLPDGDIDLGVISPGAQGTGTLQVEVDSTLSFGYQLFVSDTSDTDALVGDSGAIDDWTAPFDTPSLWAAGTLGHAGATVLTATDGKDTAKWGTGVDPDDFANLKYVGLRQTDPTLVYDRSAATAGTDVVVIGVRVAPAADQAAGDYEQTLTITAVANP